jgi:hypothetical protein
MIALITPTGARPRQIEICAELMRKQIYDGRVAWIIVDDCEPRTTDFIDGSFRSGWDIWKIYPRPVWVPGQNTQGRNLKCAIDFIEKNFDHGTIDAIFVIEDDDWYSSGYIQQMLNRISGYQIAGETHTVYYNMAIRRWVMNHNDVWSSLFQTAFTMDVIPVFRECLAEKFIDYVLFPRIESKNLFMAGNLAVGIKGQPGRAGIGAGHGWIRSMLDDSGLVKLRELIGDDVKLYI